MPILFIGVLKNAEKKYKKIEKNSIGDPKI